MTPDEYCRALESYLCRKNDGHLVRIVGPAFGQVCGWAARGVPLRIAQIGIDRYFERYYAKGPRRRPVRIEFCEADVLDAFDEWRRAVGVAMLDGDAAAAKPQPEGERDAEASAAGPEPRHGSLPRHLERVVARLTALRAGEDRRLEAVLDAIVRELDAARTASRQLRGASRDAFIARLAELDRSLLDAAREQCDEATRQRVIAAADEELATYRTRMPADAFARARSACIDRNLRDLLRLPVIAYE